MNTIFKTPCQVLIIDDDFVSNFVSKSTIQKYCSDINCTTYECAISGLDFIENNIGNIDFILLDLNMPILDGWHILETMKKNNISIPVYILSSSINPKDIERALNFTSVNAFWHKPVNFKTLENHFSLQLINSYQT